MVHCSQSPVCDGLSAHNRVGLGSIEREDTSVKNTCDPGDKKKVQPRPGLDVKLHPGALLWHSS